MIVMKAVCLMLLLQVEVIICLSTSLPFKKESSALPQLIEDRFDCSGQTECFEELEALKNGEVEIVLPGVLHSLGVTYRELDEVNRNITYYSLKNDFDESAFISCDTYTNETFGKLWPAGTEEFLQFQKSGGDSLELVRIYPVSDIDSVEMDVGDNLGRHKIRPTFNGITYYLKNDYQKTLVEWAVEDRRNVSMIEVKILYNDDVKNYIETERKSDPKRYTNFILHEANDVLRLNQIGVRYVRWPPHISIFQNLLPQTPQRGSETYK